METVLKQMFLILTSSKPGALIGKGIIYKGQHRTILDLSMSGDRILLKKGETSHEWILSETVDDIIVLDSDHIMRDADNTNDLTADTIMSAIANLNRLVGTPTTTESKSLFDIVAALNKDVLRIDQEAKEERNRGDKNDTE